MPENGMSERADRIEKKLDALSASVDARFEQVEKRFEQIDRRFNDVDRQFLEVRDHFVEQRQYIEFACDRLSKRIDNSEQKLTEGLSRVERKLDQFIESQSRPRSSGTTSRRLRPSKRRR
jgi:predicted  nucleic acid-binding Zn-ribbon protein